MIIVMKKNRIKYRSGRIFGLTPGEIIALATLVMGLVASIITGVRYFDRQFATMDERFNKIDKRLERIEGDLKTTSDLLDVYLTWRFLYTNDPTRKNLTPRYDPQNRTLEFVDKNKGSGK